MAKPKPYTVDGEAIVVVPCELSEAYGGVDLVDVAAIRGGGDQGVNGGRFDRPQRRRLHGQGPWGQLGGLPGQNWLVEHVGAVGDPFALPT